MTMVTMLACSAKTPNSHVKGPSFFESDVLATMLPLTHRNCFPLRRVENTMRYFRKIVICNIVVQIIQLRLCPHNCANIPKRV